MDMNAVVPVADEDAPVVCVTGASYVRGGYRSFEFADVSARAGQVTALLSSECAFARDLLLAVAGAVRPTSGSMAVGDASFVASAGAGTLHAVVTWSGFQRRLHVAGAVGLGVFTGLTEVDSALTVEEAVACELGCRRGIHAEAPDVLDFLATLGLATYTDQRIERLLPAARARLSAALALASAPRVAVVDLRDSFCAGLTADEELAVVRELRDIARTTGAAIMVSCTEASSSAAADAVFALDIATSETLAGVPRPCSEGVDA